MKNLILCSICGKEMTEGYIIYNTGEYLCSDDCLYSEISHSEYLEMFKSGDAYWTTFED